jgi:hypothetical protein
LRAGDGGRTLDGVRQNALTTVKRGCYAAIAICAAAIALAACSTPGNRGTGQVDSVSAGTICFKPANGVRSDLNGCWSVDSGDVVGVQLGDCLSVVVPSDPSGRVTAIRELEGTCEDGGVHTEESTSAAFATAAWFVVTGAAIVVLCWWLPRRHRRRVAEGKLASRKSPTATNPPPLEVIDEGEPVEVTIVDLDQLHHHHRHDD